MAPPSEARPREGHREVAITKKPSKRFHQKAQGNHLFFVSGRILKKSPERRKLQIGAGSVPQKIINFFFADRFAADRCCDRCALIVHEYYKLL